MTLLVAVLSAYALIAAVLLLTPEDHSVWR
jgi:hypothetical protein